MWNNVNEALFGGNKKKRKKDYRFVSSKQDLLVSYRPYAPEKHPGEKKKYVTSMFL